MNWTIFITVWIILQAILRAAKQPKQCRLEGKTEAQLMGGIAGCILWGFAMIVALYMAGLYA
jgi:hypothetical protein